jgi:glycosyltransferase involved in cell wall biosynthesis
MPTYYRVGNILCLLSRGPGETWGLVVNEFLASRGGFVLVSDRVGCAKDLIADGKGYCVSATDFNSWIQEFQKIADEASALTIYVPTPWKQLSTYRDEIVKALE